MAQLYNFIQKVAQKAEGLHTELQQRFEQQKVHIIALTEEHKQMRTENIQLQGQLDMVTKVFQELWPMVTAHNNQILSDMEEEDVVKRSIHVRVAY